MGREEDGEGVREQDKRKERKERGRGRRKVF